MQIYLIRHPRPQAIEGRCYGRMEPPVDSVTLQETVCSVMAQLPAGILASARVYSSPRLRCLGLARCLAAPASPLLTEDLAEIDFGRWEGLAWETVPLGELEAWADDIWDYRPGGGESVAMVAARWQKWLAGLRQQQRGPVVAVTHAGIVRVALATLNTPVPFGAVYCFDVPPEDTHG